MRTGTSMVDRMFRNLTNVRRLIVAVLVATVMLLLQSAVLPKPATTQCRSTMTRRVTRHRVPTRRRLANAALRSETTRNPDRPPRAYDLPPILLPQTLYLGGLEVHRIRWHRWQFAPEGSYNPLRLARQLCCPKSNTVTSRRWGFDCRPTASASAGPRSRYRVQSFGGGCRGKVRAGNRHWSTSVDRRCIRLG